MVSSEKNELVGRANRGDDINPHRLVHPMSPWTLDAGSIIAASLITGLNSDLPGLVTAQVTENVHDSVTGRVLLIPRLAASVTVKVIGCAPFANPHNKAARGQGDGLNSAYVIRHRTRLEKRSSGSSFPVWKLLLHLPIGMAKSIAGLRVPVSMRVWRNW